MMEPWNLCRQRLCASRGKAADYNGSSEDDEEEEWRPTFVQEQGPRRDQEALGSQNAVQDDPASVEKAKEKFWGRIAVISLGVRDAPCDH